MNTLRIERLASAIEENKKRKVKGAMCKMTSVKREDGRELRDHTEIANRIKEYYEMLYSSDSYQIDVTQSEDQGWRLEAPISTDEILHTCNSLQEGKATGPDNISLEMIKASGFTIIKILERLFNHYLNNGNIPKEWLEGKLILLFKKGNRADLKNYRPLTLLPVLYKIFSKIITNRISGQLELELDKNQVGFRKNHSTSDHIFTLNSLIKKSEEYSFPLCILFVDFEKAFDSIYTGKIIEVLHKRGIDNRIIKIMHQLLNNSCLKFQHEGTSVDIKVQRGLKQGDVISPKIFINVLKELFDVMQWEERGICINGEWLNHLDFADDCALISTNTNELAQMYEELMATGELFGLRINKGKTKIMIINEYNVIPPILTEIERVENFNYLGQLLSTQGNWEEIQRRCTLGWKSFLMNKHFYKAKVDIKLKKKLWESTVLPTMTYACETWSLNTKTKNKFKTTQRSMERYMLGYTKRDKKRNSWIRKQTGIRDIVEVIHNKKWKWTGHTIRSPLDKWSKILMEWYPRERRRNRGRPATRWDEEMRKVCGGSTWHRVAFERQEWRRMGEVYSKVWLSESGA